MNEFLLVLLIFVAVHRLTRLLVRDNLPLLYHEDGTPDSRVRAWIADRWGDDSWQAYLSTCPWCASVYTGAFVVGLCCALLDHGVPAPLLVWLGASTFTGLLAELEHDD